MLDMQENLDKFLETTTIHGIGHVFNQREPRFHRIIWALASIFAFYYAACVILKSTKGKIFLAKLYFLIENIKSWLDPSYYYVLKHNPRNVKSSL